MPEMTGFRAAAFTIVIAGVVAGLYYGQIVLVPVALAVLLAFLLNPVVRLFERVGLGRLVSVLAVGAVLYSALAVVFWIIAVQGSALVAALPEYRTKWTVWNVPGLLGAVGVTARDTGARRRFRSLHAARARHARSRI